VFQLVDDIVEMDRSARLTLEVHAYLFVIDLKEADGEIASLKDRLVLLDLLIVSIFLCYSSEGINLSLGLQSDLE